MHWRDQLQWQIQQFPVEETGHELGSNWRYTKSGPLEGAWKQKRRTAYSKLI